jgi:uncharacterized protein
MSMKKVIIGRVEEKKVLEDAYASIEPQFLAITGRRRVGKTYLVRTYFDSKIDFDFSGILNASYRQQLSNFHLSLMTQFRTPLSDEPPRNWQEAFYTLSLHLKKIRKSKRIVVFIDELPWLDTHRSNFLMGLDWFWNSWATKHNVLLIVCGSATSWMIHNLFNNRGGLHNRITKRVHLSPLNLKETQEYLTHHGVNLSHYQILQIYMSMGGIPYYLKEVRVGESAVQAMDRICFQRNGLLAGEFENLYKALFQNWEIHEKIIRTLAQKMRGLTRDELLPIVGLKDGGTFSKILKELEWCDFIASAQPFGKKKKDTRYRLQDEYSIFFLKFIDGKQRVNWKQLSASQSWKSWSGFAFENICIKHAEQIKVALGVGSVYCEVSSFRSKGNVDQEGTQIDLLLDRRDHVINVCEAKFYDKPFALTKALAQELRQKMLVFQAQTKTRKSMFPTIITTFGLAPNEHSIGFVQQSINMDDLFRF